MTISKGIGGATGTTWALALTPAGRRRQRPDERGIESCQLTPLVEPASGKLATKNGVAFQMIVSGTQA